MRRLKHQRAILPRAKAARPNTGKYHASDDEADAGADSKAYGGLFHLKRLAFRARSALFPTPKHDTARKGGKGYSRGGGAMRAPSTDSSYALEGTMRSVRPMCPAVAAAYGDNTVINSRYTIANFLWMNLYEQFGRPLNAYFLLVVMLQFMSVIAPVNPLSTFLPLAFAFLLTAAKEGYDDYKRHQSDKAQNSRRIHVLRSYGHNSSTNLGSIVGRAAPSSSSSVSSSNQSAEWVLVESKDLRVGDVIRLVRNDEIPADVVALSCPADANGTVYIRTDNMDGEIDLKPREVVPLTASAAATTSNSDAAASAAAAAALLSASLTQHTPTSVEASMASDGGEHHPLVPSSASSQQKEGGAVGAAVASPSHSPRAAAPAALFATDSDPFVIATALQRFTIDVPPPTVAVDKFDARLLCGGVGTAALSHGHLLPQSCFLKNTASIVAMVVYTGKDTKAALNKSPTPIKWAQIDKDVSTYSKYIFIVQLILAAVCGIVGLALSAGVEQRHWYIMPPKGETGLAAVIYPLRFFLLTTVMIPISFKFVVDISKYFMAMAIEWDLCMWDGERGVGARVRNSSILEDLGQIEYVLSDKTGTMTKNEMVLKEVSVFGHRLLLKRSAATGRAYGHAMSPTGDSATDDELALFWHALAVCNSVEVEEAPVTSVVASPVCLLPPSSSAANNAPAASSAPLTYTYAAVSPDEEALCVAAAAHGHRLVERTKVSLRVAVMPTGFAAASPVPSQPPSAMPSSSAATSAGEPTFRDFIVEQTFAFASELKCMSVLITDPTTGRTHLFSKGADDKLMSLLSPAFTSSPAGRQRINKVNNDLEAFAASGLRTLLVCYREVPVEEVRRFNKAHAEAMLEMEGRAERLLALRAGLERDMTLIGATAIEDCLQEGVAQTISDLLDANIKVWMLTGDKVETAEQIALSCGLMAASDTVIPVYGDEWEAELRRAADPAAYVRRTGRPLPNTPSVSALATPAAHLANSNNATEMRGIGMGFGEGIEKGTVLIVQGGRVLERILSTPALMERFVAISSRCKAVVCARVTPIQKAQVTAMVRRRGKLTLAIGDGGNDVAMIQEAHVGVGIVGREGKQAALASDFSFTKFRYLSPLLFYHGHQSYARTAFVVQYSFYKSMLIAFIQILFNIWVTYMSGGSFWDSLALTAWNGLYTLPQTIFFVFDRVAPRTVLEQNPFLYRLPQRGYAMTRTTFFGHIAKGALQSCAALWLIYSISSGAFVTSEAGNPETAGVTFLAVYSSFMWLQVLTVLLESNAVGLFNAIATFGMPLAYYFISESFYEKIPTVTAMGAFRHSMTGPLHLATLLITFTLYAPHLLYYVVQKVFFPTALDVLRHDEVSRLSQRGYIVSTARTARFTTKGIVAKLLLAGEIIARSFVIVEEPGEDLARQMEQKRLAKQRQRQSSAAGPSAGGVDSATCPSGQPPLHPGASGDLGRNSPPPPLAVSDGGCLSSDPIVARQAGGGGIRSRSSCVMGSAELQ